MINFQFYAPTKILFGKGQIDLLGDEIRTYGRKVLLAYGKGSIKRNGVFDAVIKELKKNGLEYVELSGIDPNPRISTVEEGARLCRKHNVDFVLAVGGGSVIDCAKGIAFAALYDGDPWDHWDGKAKIDRALPVGSVLTLAATGSEMNHGSVITNERLELKQGKGHPLFIPKFSILDPEYTYSVSPYQTAAGVVDIMSHVYEFYFSPVKGAMLQDSFAKAILKTCIKYGPIALREGDNYEARANLMWASSMALNGVISRGKTFEGVLHSLEHSISALYDLTHGVGLAILTIPWFETVLDETTVWKFADFARNVWDLQIEDDFEAAKAAIEKNREFYKSLGIPLTLSEAGIDDKRFDEILDRSLPAQSASKGSFKALDREGLKNLLIKCL